MVPFLDHPVDTYKKLTGQTHTRLDKDITMEKASNKCT